MFIVYFRIINYYWMIFIQSLNASFTCFSLRVCTLSLYATLSFFWSFYLFCGWFSIYYIFEYNNVLGVVMLNYCWVIIGLILFPIKIIWFHSDVNSCKHTLYLLICLTFSLSYYYLSVSLVIINKSKKSLKLPHISLDKIQVALGANVNVILQIPKDMARKRSLVTSAFFPCF